MKIAIIEDEEPAANKLERYLLKHDSKIEIVVILKSVEEAVPWLIAHQSGLSLIFMDIQLVDGLSFEIFAKLEQAGTAIQCPVIFATAYDEFAIDAFQVNGIAYLLKPITFIALTAALKKFESLKIQFNDTSTIQSVAKTLQAGNDPSSNIKGVSGEFKDRFMVKVGDHIQSIKTDDISLFYAEGRTVYLVNKEGKRYIIEYKLEALQELLSPAQFYRVNRTFIVGIDAVTDVVVYSNSRLKISVINQSEKEIVVSREKVSTFKKWFEGGK